jgi:hypothetical protein
MDDKVIVNIECNPQAASVLLPILRVCQMMGDLGMANYCCFFVDGENDKVIKVGVPTETPVVERAVVQAACGFAYNIDGKVYKRFPDEKIHFIDHGTGQIDAPLPKKKWGYCNRRFDMENTIE